MQLCQSSGGGGDGRWGGTGLYSSADLDNLLTWYIITQLFHNNVDFWDNFHQHTLISELMQELTWSPDR